MEIELKAKKGKKKAHPRLPNGFGSVVTLSGKRRKPYMARPPVKKWDDNGNPIYDKPIGYYAEWIEAFNALADYNRNPYDTNSRYLTFEDIFKLWYKHKFKVDMNDKSNPKTSSQNCYIGAYRKSAAIHAMIFSEMKTINMQSILDDNTLSRAYMEHIQNLYVQLYKYALEYDIVQKNYASFVKITKAEDDEQGVPFTNQEIDLLWKNKEKPYVDTILIFIYSGWRISELLKMPIDKFDLDNMIMQGGIKTRAGKNRIVPIHSKVYDFIKERKSEGGKTLVLYNNQPITNHKYLEIFKETLSAIGIVTKHTPHDCRHTFASLLNNAGANKISIQRLLGHAGGDITDKIYTHKDIDELRKAIELI